MAGLKGVALVSPVELHSLDPVESHASLREGDVVSKTEKGWTVAKVWIGTVKSCFVSAYLDVDWLTRKWHRKSYESGFFFSANCMSNSTVPAIINIFYFLC